MADFTYMGTKRQLADRIVRASEGARSGPFLDLFSGLSAVGAAMASARPVWCNDVQRFSQVYTAARFTSQEDELWPTNADEKIEKIFHSNRIVLEQCFRDLLEAEKDTLRSTSSEHLAELEEQIRLRAPAYRNRLLSEGAYCLFATTYAGGYVSLRQAIEIDSIRAALDRALLEHLSAEQHRWGLVALCRAVQNASNSTGHFAQFLKPNARNLLRVVAKRRRSAFSCWTASLQELQPHGSQRWRSRNMCFASEAVALLEKLALERRSPAVIYADPPYTADQYSRYYHVLESVVLYDYPAVAGVGLYRPDRFVSDFSLASKVESAFERLIAAARMHGSRLIISYPAGGLLKDSTSKITDMLRYHFPKARMPETVSHMHSTMGGSKGKQKHLVQEQIFVADL